MVASPRRRGTRARRVRRRSPDRGAAGSRGRGQALARAPAPARHQARDHARCRARTALGAAALRRHLRPAGSRLDARHVRRAGTGRRRGAHRGHDAARRLGSRRGGRERTRCRRSVGGRRAAGHRGPRVRNGLDRTCGQGRGPGQCVRERGQATGRRRRGRRPARGAIGGRRPAGCGCRPAGRRAGAQSASGARTGHRLPDRRRERRRRAGARGDRNARARAPCPARSRRRATRPAHPRCRRRVRRPVVRSGRRRLRDRRQPRPPDRRLGACGRGARARELHEAGDPSAAHAFRPRPAAARRRSPGRSRGNAGARAGGAEMRTLPDAFTEYKWAPSTEELARRVGLDAVEIIRFDGNVPDWPAASARPATVAAALARVNEYAHGGYPELLRAIADHAGVEPANIVLGAGADDLILLCARAFAGPADQIAIAEEPTYPRYAIAAALAGAEVGDTDPALTFCCRPNNPTGALDPLPTARPLVVDEAYWEYAGDTATGLIDEGVVVLRTFSKAFRLAGARVGSALADIDTATELNRRQAPQ